MELSALATKQAAMIGAGAATAATAITVPIVVTQKGEDNETIEGAPGSQTSSKEIDTTDKADLSEQTANDYVGSFSYKLSMDSNSFFENFNKPGDCVKRAFKGIEESNFFATPNPYNSKHGDIKHHQPFSTKTGKPDLACYTYNLKENGDEKKGRVEMLIQWGNEGWVFMSGLKEDGENVNLWYREFYVQKPDSKETWEVTAGHEGEISKTTAYAPAFPDLWNTNFSDKVKEVDIETEAICTNKADDPCGDIRIRVGYWKPDDDTKKKLSKLVQTAGNSGNNITRWTDKNPLIDDDNNRKHIYQGGKWYSYQAPTAQSKNKKLISLNDTNTAHSIGFWDTLVGVCTKENKGKDTYRFFCK